MQTRETVLRILRLNMIPAPRVVTPGPATKFPVLHVDSQGMERTVRSLEEARSLSKAVAGSYGDKQVEDYFIETLPVRSSVDLQVSGFSATTVRGCMETADGSCASDARVIAVRAVYVLGFDQAVVTVGLGRGGPWVLGARPSASKIAFPAPQESRVEFLGARVEYLVLDRRTGMPAHDYFSTAISPDGEMTPSVREGALWEVRKDKWVSSPMPYPGMPLSTRLLFSGVPSPRFLRALDQSVAVLGMLASPLDEDRDRHATEEGMLGAYRVVDDRHFEYLPVPGLLWNPQAVRRICESARAAAASFNLSDCDGDVFAPPSGFLENRLDAIYEFQRAYYHVDKDFFVKNAESAGTVYGSRAKPDYDFRPAWGIEAPALSEPWATVGSSCETPLFFGNIPSDASVDVTAGARSVPVLRERLISPDILERDKFDRNCAAWAPNATLRPNPSLAESLALPGDMLYRASAVGGNAPHESVICVGPVVGIMAPEYPDGSRFGIETDRFRQMIRAGTDMGLLVYVFFPDSVDWDARLAKAWTYRDRRGWFQEWLPLPDIVYDRHIPDVMPPSRIRDVALEFQQRYPEARFINSLPFVRTCRDKFKTHRVLARHPEILAHLPETEVALDPTQVARFAVAHRASFLKLRGGTGSKGLVFIENLGERFRVSRREKGRSPEVSVVSSRAELEQEIVGVICGGEGVSRDYIIQDGIDLAPLPDESGSTFEVRVVYQKGGAGRWLRTGMVCRVSPAAERFMVPREELHRRAGELLSEAFPGRANAVEEEIRRVARMIPPAVEEGSGPGGEMSVDLGIDRRGKPWLIEVNSKPATLFRDIGAFEYRTLSLVRVLNYAVRCFIDR